MGPVAIAITAAAVIIVLCILWAVKTVNGFRIKEIRVSESLSGIETALTERYDSLTKLLDTVKGYMTHEKEVYREVISLRKGMTVGELKDADRQISQFSDRLLAVAESYPELHSAELFVSFGKEIRRNEENLQAARRTYNADVTAYNTAISIFPAKLLAGARKPMEFFEAEEHKKEDVKIKF